MYVSPIHSCFFPETIVGVVFKLRWLEFGVKSSLMAKTPKSVWIWWRQLPVFMIVCSPIQFGHIRIYLCNIRAETWPGTWSDTQLRLESMVHFRCTVPLSVAERILCGELVPKSAVWVIYWQPFWQPFSTFLRKNFEFYQSAKAEPYPNPALV